MAKETTPSPAKEIAPPQPKLFVKSRRRGPLWRLFGWGCAACLSLAIAVLTSQTEAGSTRLWYAFNSPAEPARAVADLPRTGASAADTQHLVTQVRDLTADRDRLNARIATLERHLDDMTGSIKRQNAEIVAGRTVTPPPVPNAPATMTLAPPPPAELPFFLSMRMPQAAEPPLPPQRTEPVPLPPTRGEFAIDLGGAATIEALRAYWVGLSAKHGPLLAGLQPRIAEHQKQPSGTTYRLLAGPLPNAEEAARLCARFLTTRVGCHPTKFIGVELAAH